MSKTKTSMPRKYASNVKLRIGPLVVEGDIYPKQRNTTPKVTLVTENGEEVKTVYQGPDGTIYGSRDELNRRIDGDQIVTNEQLEAAKEAAFDSAKNVISLVVHPAEADDYMVPSDSKTYVFIPKSGDKENMQWYRVFRHIIGNTDKVFVGEAKVSRSKGLFRVSVKDGHLIVQKHCYPSEVVIYDEIEGDGGEYGEKFAAALGKLEQDFNPDDYQNAMTNALLAAGDVTVEDKPDEADISNALDSFLDTL